MFRIYPASSGDPGHIETKSTTIKFLSGFVSGRVFSNEEKMTDSQQLLAAYVSGSEAAFRELAERYMKLVYSAAVRLVDADTHLAEDVTQTVFVDLARKANSLSGEVMLGGWLHRHTCFVAAKTMRAERRRRNHERQALEMTALPDHSEANLAQVAPVLDDAVDQLGPEDRAAILLRFFEQRDLRSVGEILGSTEDAARKRVARALEKLHVLLKHRGVTLSAATLGAALAAEAVTAAPAGMAATIAATALASSAASAGTTLTLIKLMTMTKLQLGIVSAVLAAGVATPLVIQRQAQAKLREKDTSLRQQADQLAQLAAENQRLSHLLDQANTGRPAPGDQTELLRLRAQVSRLRATAQQKEAEASDPASGIAKSLAARATQLKQILQQMPDKKIPELQFLSEQDCLDAVKNSNLDTEAGYRKALSQLRGIAKQDFGAILRPALESYLQTHDGQLPNDLAELKPLMQPPVEDSILDRYSLLLNGKVPNLTRETLLVAEVAPPADPDYDTVYLFRLAGQKFATVDPNISTMLDAAKEYARANNGQVPNDTTQLGAYLKRPVDEPMQRAFLNYFPPNATLHLK